MLAFASMRSTPFMEFNDKGERLYKGMKALGERLRFEHGQWTKREQALKNVRGSKFLNKRSTLEGGASS
jgi:hypothetical protein